MKYNPHIHIVGKVYDLTQENMNSLLDEIDKLNLKLKELHSDSLEDHQEYKRTTTQLIKDLREENARYRETLQAYADLADGDWYGPDDKYYNIGHTAREALGLDEPDEVYDYDGL